MTYSPGARASKRNGPAPDPNSLRSLKRGAEWIRLSRNVRDGKETPEWPHYLEAPTMEELAFWNELWGKPQAEFWIRDGVVSAVAMYCRTFISAMQKNAFITEKSASERMAATLLLTVPALLAAKVMIVDDVEEIDPDAPPGTPATVQPIGSVRNRFTVVNPSANDVGDDENESSSASDD